MKLTFNDILIRIILSFILGGIIGWEREKKKRDAGLRTHILVSIGSTLIMLVSLHIYDIYSPYANIDPARIASGVVTGIGFLGAGAIVRSAEQIKGLTTAATIWVSSAIGLSVGLGFLSAAVVTTVIVFFTLTFLKKVEKSIE
ncbi:MAG: MgtC/SapB family protein [Candidatus Omnitrophica bacterium]|nr:MgtC/SapB family protein [Candidatus Omnitrophota bacterium]MCM8826935.1 MgtC/SapB family protein [Candidatus Omnitrophota bacterium]